MIPRTFPSSLLAIILLIVYPSIAISGTMDEVVCPANRSINHTDNVIKGKRHLNDVLLSSVFKVVQVFDEGGAASDNVATGVGTATLIDITNGVATLITAGHLFQWENSGVAWKNGYSYSIKIPIKRDIIGEMVFKRFELNVTSVIRHPYYSYEALDVALIKVDLSDNEANFFSEIPQIPVDFKFYDLDIDGNLNLLGYRSSDDYPMLVSDIPTRQNSGAHYSSDRVYDGQSGSLLVSDYGVGFGIQSGYDWNTESQKDFGKIKIVPLYEVADFIMDVVYPEILSHSSINLILNKILLDTECSSYGCLDNQVGLWKVNNLIRKNWKQTQLLSYAIMRRVSEAIIKDKVIRDYIDVGGEFSADLSIINNKLLVMGTDERNREILSKMIGCAINREESKKYLLHSSLWEYHLTKLYTQIKNSQFTSRLHSHSESSSEPGAHFHPEPETHAHPEPGAFNGFDSNFVLTRRDNKKRQDTAVDILVERKRAHLARVMRLGVRKRQAASLGGIIKRNSTKDNETLKLADDLQPSKDLSPTPRNNRAKEICSSFTREFDTFEIMLEKIADKSDRIEFLETTVVKRRNQLRNVTVSALRNKNIKDEISLCLQSLYAKIQDLAYSPQGSIIN